MGQIEDLKLFVTVVDQGSIARAAAALGIAKSAVSRRLAQLEQRYDLRLIDRDPGRWEVTDAGRELYRRAEPMLAEADDLDNDFTPAARDPGGPLRVTIAREFGMSFLRPMLFDFARTHPEIALTLDFDDRTVDLERENYDLAIRITAGGAEPASQLHLGTTRHGLFASPAYLDRVGAIHGPSDLRGRALLHYGASRRPTWVFHHGGKRVDFAFKPRLNSNTGAFLIDAATRGVGIVRLPDFVAHEAVRDGALVPVLAEATFPAFGIHLIHAPNRRLNRRMRAFIEAVKHQCGAIRP
ncbi:MAG: LysR family transcriptional regulator [Silicimonas sp.]|nr:LysR family transcriptional regulator [Silicimonas sp.]